MIEVLFAESESESMKAAKSTIIKMKTDGPTSVWFAGKKKPPKREHTGWMEGTSDEVICLGFMLDIGNIQEEIDSPYREKLIYDMRAQDMYAQEQKGKNLETDVELRNLAKAYVSEMQRLKEYLEKGETIRIWYSDAAYSACGFYHLCSILSKYENPLRIVKLPEHVVHGNVIISCKNWGEVAAEEFAGFLHCERELRKEEVRMYQAMWNELREDNSPLRARLNGKMVGVPEDFYDFLIWKILTKAPIKEARLIGNILGKYPVNMRDSWYAKRIDYLITQGKIKVVEDSENSYARWICQAQLI